MRAGLPRSARNDGLGGKYHIETMGCQMNERDSETIAGILESEGYTAVDSSIYNDKERRAAADVIVVNTCSVRENADNRFFGVLGQIKKHKEVNPNKLVAVCGCMMQQDEIISKIKEKYSWVDIVFGTHNIHRLPTLLAEVSGENSSVYSVFAGGGEIVEGLPSRRAHPYKAFVNVINGCNNFCTYCIVPYTRGREFSREPGPIIDEVSALAADGVKEIMLLGQNVNSYRATDGTDFAELIRRVNEVSGIERIRFMTSHPKDIPDSLIALFGDVDKLMPAIHLPVQSGSDRILKLMNRQYDSEYYLGLIAKLQAVRPDIVISTDLIVGFPGETEDDHEQTMDLIEKARFDSAFTFIYSPRSGTPAAEYEDQVPERIKHERFERMVDRLNQITLEKNQAYVGRTELVFFEGYSKTRADMLQGRTPGGKLVNVAAPNLPDVRDSRLRGNDNLRENDNAHCGIPAKAGISEQSMIGRIVPVKIEVVNTFSFIGALCNE